MSTTSSIRHRYVGKLSRFFFQTKKRQEKSGFSTTFFQQKMWIFMVKVFKTLDLEIP